MTDGKVEETPSAKSVTTEVDRKDISVEDVVIAVMGPSGAGKSSFINTATGSREAVNDTESCTTKVATIKFHSPDKGKPDFALIDTPGFNHDHKTDGEVLGVIADWLKATYERGVKLAGILYIHKIWDAPSGTHRRNINMFEKLCGKEALQNVIIATTMWDKSGEEWGSELEEKLFEENPWAAIKNRVLTTVRYCNTQESAWDILGSFRSDRTRHAVRLQNEMVDMGRQLHETAAGQSWGILSEPNSRLTLSAMLALYDNFSNRVTQWQRFPNYKSGSESGSSVPPNAGDLSPGDVVIAVIGPTGSGKSSFINTLTGGESAVGHGLESCTKEIVMMKVDDVVLVDTPGFDDTFKPDIEILRMLADWLTETYKRGVKLSGILYFHRISDNRVSGAPLMNLHMFEKLCGKNAFQNVILTTTMWDKVDALAGLEREKELRSGCWKGMINQGSKTVRYRNTRDSAWDILDSVIGHTRVAMLLQEQMVDMQRQLRETDAGKTLYNDLESLVKRQQVTLEDIRSARVGQTNQGVLGSLQDEYEELRTQIETTTAEMQKLKIPVGKRFLRYFTIPLSKLKHFN